MARKRDYRAEYQRRVAGTAPGSAARQAARGHHVAAGETEYRRRVAGARTPAERRVAAGHGSLADLNRFLRRHGEGALVSIDPSGSERDPQGQWRRVHVLVLDENGDEHVFRLSGRQLDEHRLRRLVQLVDTVGGISSPTYPLRKLLDANETEEQTLVFVRRGRLLRGFDTLGRALTTTRQSDALVFGDEDDALELAERRGLFAKRFELEDLYLMGEEGLAA